MLPSSKEIRNNENKAKFVDTGIELLIEKNGFRERVQKKAI